MKKTITILRKAALTVLLFFVAQATYAAFYAYKGIPVTINGGGTFTEYQWVFTVSPGATNTVITGQTGATLTHTFTVAGSYTLRLTVKQANGCWSDPIAANDIEIFVLPDFDVTVALDGSIPASYCTNAAADKKTTLLATVLQSETLVLPAGVTLAFADWYKTPITGALTGLSSISTDNPYTLTETGIGLHYYVATGAYTLPTGSQLLTAVPKIKSGPFTVEVLAAPTTPAITPTVITTAP